MKISGDDNLSLRPLGLSDLKRIKFNRIDGSLCFDGKPVYVKAKPHWWRRFVLKGIVLSWFMDVLAVLWEPISGFWKLFYLFLL